MEFLSLCGWWSEPMSASFSGVSVPWWETLCLGSTGTPLWGPLWLRALPTGSPHCLSKTSGLGQEVGLSSAANRITFEVSLQGTSKFCSWSDLWPFLLVLERKGKSSFPISLKKSNWGKFCCLDNGILKCLAKARIYKKLSLTYKN